MKSAIVLGVTAAMMAFGAYANDAGDKAKSFESLDKNADGRITPSEASAREGLSSSFSTADVNADGGLTKQEYNSWSMGAQPRSTTPDSSTMDPSSPRTDSSDMDNVPTTPTPSP